MKKILLTFDIEEFDLPREYGLEISEKEMYEISKQGLDSLKNLLDKYNIKSTFFTTANFAKKFPDIIRQLSEEGHEIACHGFCHSDSCIADLSRAGLAKKEIEKIIKKEVAGFRAPRFEIKNHSALSEIGFSYDSSFHPTIAPGKYLNFNQKRKIHKIGELTEIPLSTLPLFPFIRSPFNWYMFRHFPFIYGKLFTKINFFYEDYLTLLLHPWEFTDLSKFKIPSVFRKKSGNVLSRKLEKYILFCKKQKYDFSTIREYLSKRTI